MTKRTVLAISGSPSATSKSARLADYVLSLMVGDDVEVEHIHVRDLSAEALMSVDLGDASISRYGQSVARAHGIVLTTPIFKAAYTGLLKAALDLLPQYAMAGKVVLPLATGGSPAHVLALDYGLRPVLQSMGVRHVVQGHFVADAQIVAEPFELEAGARGPLLAAVANFMHSLTVDESAKWLGHPRPPSD